MANLADRFNWTRRLAAVGATFLAFLGIGATAYGAQLAKVGGFSSGSGFILTGVALIGLSLLLYSHVVLTHRVVNNSYRMYDAMLEVSQTLKRHSDWLHQISENSSQSEWSKRIIYREKDYEFLRDTIHGLVVRQDWEATDHFIDEVDKEFGYHEEAQRLRAEVTKARSATTEEKVQAALVRFNKLCGERKWDRAVLEIERLRVLFPNENRIAELPRELEHRKSSFKQVLLNQYNEAVRVQDVDRAHDLLFELDQYLTPAEATGLRHSARGVFRAKLHQLGAQFSLAIAERNYDQAIEVGHQLIEEFPNTRYAREIEDMIPKLQRRKLDATTNGNALASGR